MKNRTIIGIVCIIAALVVTFAVAPLVNKLADSKTEIVRVKQDVVRGHMISENDVEKVQVGSYNLPADVITDTRTVVGRFAAVDLKAGDYLLPSKITTDSDSAEDVFRTLNGEKQAISITIPTFAGGLSGKLQNGDIVQLIVYDNNRNKTIVPGALTYVRVITATTPDGTDKDQLVPNEDGTYELPSTLTLLVNGEQAKELVKYENSGTIHAELVYRGDSETANKFLQAQEEYFKRQNNNTSPDPLDPDDPDEEFDIVKYANDIINGKVPANLPDAEVVADE